MVSKSFRVKLRRFHKWIGVLVGIQLFFWIGSGAYFAWMPFKIIKDEDRKSDVDYPPLDLTRLLAPAQLKLPADIAIKALHLETVPAGLVYRVETLKGEVSVWDAVHGEALGHLPEGQIAELARQQLKIDTAASRVELMHEPPAEYRGPKPVYQVSWDDFRQTRLYADPWTGRVIARRNRYWRIYDFLWMLHILDFKEREDFNNPWIKALSLFGLVLITSGYLLFFFGKLRKSQQNING